MSELLPIVVFIVLIGAWYASIDQPRTLEARGALLVAALFAGLPLLEGSELLVTTLAIAGALALLAALVSGLLRVRRRKYVTAPALVTSVSPVTSGGQGWRVGFAYLLADGTACESADVVFVSGVQPGDSCVAVYSRDRPRLATLRLAERASS